MFVGCDLAHDVCSVWWSNVSRWCILPVFTTRLPTHTHMHAGVSAMAVSGLLGQRKGWDYIYTLLLHQDYLLKWEYWKRQFFNDLSKELILNWPVCALWPGVAPCRDKQETLFPRHGVTWVTIIFLWFGGFFIMLRLKCAQFLGDYSGSFHAEITATSWGV